MKKKLLVILVLVMMSMGLYAQQAGTHTFGFRLGMAFGLWAGLEDDGYSSWSDGMGGWGWYEFEESNRSNFNFAVYYAYTFRDNFSLQIELNYMINQGIDVESQGGHTHGGSWSDSHEFTYTSIDIPVLLRYNFFHGFFGLLIGPHISIPLMGDYVDDIQVTFGITAGVQGFFPLGAGFLVGDVRFIADFNEIVDGSDIRRQALAITVGYEWSF